jgi:UDP-N-acetylglucosamine transferase subunit ALG13
VRRGRGQPSVFVTVGTDHHQFDRLVSWVDGWLALGGEDTAACFLQRGTSKRPARAQSTEYLGYQEMQALVRDAIAVVSHGGPGTIMLAVYLGKKPIVVPRQSSLGEHVDDHQVRFARRLAAKNEIELAETKEHFYELLDRAVSTARVEAPRVRTDVTATVRRFERLIEVALPALGGAR